ncbi:major royal jelly protein 2-like isoform X2 [Harmonia axyridis]|uniref:major royal jelly protein 2-like isoform X2 n=1 Tax=Harmonia axyridis TaxID=115357 RepID=UPI001E27910A|nr:major royal jelly protein 2-like isoform X2 [Harmonia axyridis]
MNCRWNWICFICSTILVSFTQSALPVPQSVGPQAIFEWTQVEYKYPNQEERQKDIDCENFIPGVPVIIDVDVAFNGDEKRRQYFVTTPRFQAGIPATLGKVTNEKIGSNNVIEPYPNWSWHRDPTKCLRDRLISVFRVEIDTCGRLWVLDNGSYQDDLICSPQIIAFDLKTNQVVYRYEIPANLLQSNSLLVTPVVDVTDGCLNPFVYAADCQANSLIVYDQVRNSSWRIQDKTMYPDPNWGTYTILGESFDLMDGILGMAMNGGQEPKKLFYHAMSSNTEHAVKISELRNESQFKDNPNSSPDVFHTYRGRRRSQSPAEAIDKYGILYFGDVNEVTLNCWDTATEYGPRHIRTLSNNHTILQFTSGMKVRDSFRHNQDLFVVTSRFQKVSLGTLNPKEVNFRVLKLQLNHFTKRKCS